MNYRSAYTCPRCSAINHGGFSSGGCGLCGYNGYEICTSSSLYVAQVPQQKQITITEQEFDKAWELSVENFAKIEESKIKLKKALGF